MPKQESEPRKGAGIETAPQAWSPRTQGSGPALQRTESVAVPVQGAEATARRTVEAILESLHQGKWDSFAAHFLPDAAVLDEFAVVPFARLESYLRPLFELIERGVPVFADRVSMRSIRIDVRGAVALIGRRVSKRETEVRALVLLRSEDVWRIKHFHAPAFGIELPTASRPSAESTRDDEPDSSIA